MPEWVRWVSWRRFIVTSSHHVRVCKPCLVKFFKRSSRVSIKLLKPNNCIMWEGRGGGGRVYRSQSQGQPSGQAAIQCLISHDSVCVCVGDNGGKGADDNAILNSPANPATMTTMRPQIALGERKGGEWRVQRGRSSCPAGQLFSAIVKTATRVGCGLALVFV